MWYPHPLQTVHYWQNWRRSHKRGTPCTLLSITHQPDLLEVPHSWETCRESRTLRLWHRTTVTNSTNWHQRSDRKLYYKIQLEICSINLNNPITQDTLSRESCSLTKLTHKSRRDIHPNRWTNLNWKYKKYENIRQRVSCKSSHFSSN
jgi:hypothetical protein